MSQVRQIKIRISILLASRTAQNLGGLTGSRELVSRRDEAAPQRSDANYCSGAEGLLRDAVDGVASRIILSSEIMPKFASLVGIRMKELKEAPSLGEQREELPNRHDWPIGPDSGWPQSGRQLL